MNVHLEEASAVQRRVEQHKQALVRYIRSCVSRIFPVLPHLLYVVIAVQKLKPVPNFDDLHGTNFGDLH